MVLPIRGTENVILTNLTSFICWGYCKVDVSGFFTLTIHCVLLLQVLVLLSLSYAMPKFQLLLLRRKRLLRYLYSACPVLCGKLLAQNGLLGSYFSLSQL